MNQPNHTQVVIVGGGPIGIELAVALKQNSIDSQVIEAGPIGHTISWWAPQTNWFSSNERISIAGVPLMTMDGSKATREEYLTYLRSVVAQFELSIRTFQRVTAIDRLASGGFSVTTGSAGGRKCETVTCERVVLAIGGTDFARSLGVPGDDLPHVDGYLREPHRYSGRRVMIVGGRNSAVEAALRLHHAGANVEISYRGSELPTASIKYWLTPEILGLIDAGRIVAHFGTVPVEITPDHIVLRRCDDGRRDDETTISVAVDDVLSLIGYQQDKSLFRAAGIELVELMQRPVYDPETMQTNVDGVYVAGTAVAGTQNSKYKTFLENCHQHVDKIVVQIAGGHATGRKEIYESQIELQPES